MATIEITITEDAVVEPVVTATSLIADVWADSYNRIAAALGKTQKQRDALVVERDAILAERDAIIEESNGYLYMADHAKGEWRKAEAALAKANAGFESAYRVLKKRRDDCDSNNLQLAERNVNLRYELEQSEAKRLELLHLLDEKDAVIDDFSKQSAQQSAELASTKQQLTELKLKHNQPDLFPWAKLWQPGVSYFLFNPPITKPATNITTVTGDSSKPAAGLTEVKN